MSVVVPAEADPDVIALPIDRVTVKSKYRNLKFT